MNKREAAKLATREKVLVAARALFSDPGYENTTVRMIAQRAEISSGGVFTVFESKEAILAEIVIERYEALADHLDQVLRDTPGSARARMKAAFAAAYGFEHHRHALLMRQIGASWSWSPSFEAESQRSLAKPFGFVGRLLVEAASTGEIAANADIPMLADLLLGVYLRMWRHGWYRRLDVAGMAALADPQIDNIFKGAAP